MVASLANRLDAIEPLIMAQSGSLEPVVYGVVDRVDLINGKPTENVIRRWTGEIGKMEPTDKEPNIHIVEKLEPFILKHKKYKCLFGGRGGMKTRFAQSAFVGEVQAFGEKAYVLRERMTSLKESVYSGIETTIKRMNAGGFLSVPSKWEIRNSNGGRFVFGGMQNIIDMKGAAAFKRFLMEEAEKTSQNMLDTIGPTLRDMPGAELWYLWNTGSSQDPMSREFITPYQAELDKCGYYEDDYHMIVKLTYRDNPWFLYDESLQQELEKDRQKVSRGIMTPARFRGIWDGEFNDDVAASVIKEDWFNACIDAHKNKNFEALGSTVVSADPSDIGSDPFGYAARKGVVFFNIDEIDGENGNRKMDAACRQAIQDGCDSFGYDADGLGATLRDNVDKCFKGKNTYIYAYKGSGAVNQPEAPFKSESIVLTNRSENLLNKDAFKNRKAQNIISVADRIFRTWEVVVEGKMHDPETLISFDSETIKPEMMQKLKAEACKMPIKPGPTVQFYTKAEMRKGIILPDGNRLVIPSPNLFDAVVLSFDEQCIMRKTKRIDVSRVNASKVSYW